MTEKASIILGLAVAGIGLYALTKKAVAIEYMNLMPDIYYHLVYIGPNKTFMDALGECYPVIYTIDVYDEETNDWIPPADPEHDILVTGAMCRIMVQAPCKLYGFRLP